ncbi:pentatricopeptide repeat-containing protein At4g04370 [Primulina eburnea]|uniref:pentatricopeptide repeat-containing protein At4g04370 n=1 Tax=Primulina eburnea TaxID=1245227 RepID=UPI003C6CC02F
MNAFKPQLLHSPKSPPVAATVTSATKWFNSIINRLSVEGFHRQALLIFASMLNSTAAAPDAFTYPSLLKSCTSLNLFNLGLSLHQHLIVSGYSSDPYISSSLINFYAKLKNSQYARRVFDMMPQRNIVPWTAIIGCYSRAGDMENAFFLYNSMQYEGVQPSSITILTMLSGVTVSVHLDVLHSCIIKRCYTLDIALMNCMLSVYAKCRRVEEAEELFELLEDKDTVSWNSLINAYSMVGNLSGVSKLFNRMRYENAEPDEHTFGALVSAAVNDGSVEVGKIIHGQILTSGFGMNKHLQTSLVVMYSRCGQLDEATQIFKIAGDKDVISWTAMISGLVQNDSADKALQVFRQMLVFKIIPSTATMACVLASCGQLGSVKLGTSIHCYILRQRMAVDIPTQNSLVSMYAKCGHLEQSLAVFCLMEERDKVSWNAIVAGYAQSGYLTTALHLFNEMRLVNEEPDSVTIISLLQSCASLGACHQGKWIHNFVFRSSLGPCIRIGTALVDMYAKCGELDYARKCFESMPQHDTISWSTIIAGYGTHGKGETALEMYSKFLKNKLAPNDVIFLSVLYACSHNGLVDHGMSLFESMKKHNVKPKLEHCACIVDLLCRAGRIQDSYNFYMKMFSEPVSDVLGIMLDSCRRNGEIELGAIIAKEISELKPVDAGKYVQLAHSFASTAKWDGVGESWVQMRSLGLRKVPGWSSIGMQGSITPFFNHHSSHPQYANIVSLLRKLSNDMTEIVLSSECEDVLLFDPDVLGK